MITPLADAYGRKYPYLAGLFCQVFLYCGMLFTSNVYVFIGLCFLYGIGISCIYTIGFCLFMENLPRSHQVQLGMLLTIVLSMELIFISVYLEFLTKDWRFLMYASICLTIICLIASMYLVVESPRYLMEKGRREAA